MHIIFLEKKTQTFRGNNNHKEFYEVFMDAKKNQKTKTKIIIPIFFFFTGNTFHKINNKTTITIVDICLARVSSFKKKYVL